MSPKTAGRLVGAQDAFSTREQARRKSPPALRRRIGRWALRLSFLVLVLVLVGVVVQAVAERRDAAAHPPPGDLVTLPGGRDLHLQVAGEGNDGPTVVLEAGAGSSSSSWAWVQPAVAERFRVVAYDRAGLGWSDPRPDREVGTDAVVDDLRSALEARGVDGPLVLVGHSLGGHYVRAFAAAHPDEVAGVVLVDPTHEDQAAVVGPSDSLPSRLKTWAMRGGTRLGLTRLYNPVADDVRGLPEPERSQALAQMKTGRNVSTFAAESTAADRIGAEVAGAELGQMPLRVLIAGSAANEAEQPIIDELRPLKRQLADLSAEGEHLYLPDADHVGLVTRQRHADAVSETVIELAEGLSDSAGGPPRP